jgi:hypothetical protein
MVMTLQRPGHCTWNRYFLAFKTVFADGNGNDSVYSGAIIGDIVGQQAQHGKLYVCDCEKKKNKWEVVLTFHGRNSWADGDVKVYKGRVILSVLV